MQCRVDLLLTKQLLHLLNGIPLSIAVCCQRSTENLCGWNAIEVFIRDAKANLSE
jgi:hypothetical protein